MIEQGSAEWHELRSVRFTGSDINDLLTQGRRDMTAAELEQYKKDNPGGKRKTIDIPFGDTALNYIFKKATNIVFGRNEDDELFETIDIKRGKEYEPFAFTAFQELKKLDFINVQKTGFWTFGNDAGASPDGIVGNDACLEIKCPRPDKFFALVYKGAEAIDPEYIAQMQMEMLCTNSKRCHFFNYIIYNGTPMWHEIIVERDEAMIELIKDRIAQATVVRDKYVVELREKMNQFALVA